ncbi:MAG: hypothetical protein JWM12_489 [Ilumatobacteraceae bacterium]|nr:hypothetical protein [Ilumatobacteraceae bacterium]
MSDELQTVVLRGLPLDLHRRAEVHGATLRRELALVHTADQQGAPPARLLWWSHHLNGRYDRFTTGQKGVVEEAFAGDHGSIDLRFDLPVHAADAAEQLGRALEEVDAYCRSGDLVTLAASEEILAYQRWFLDEFVGQLREGRAPRSWSDSRAGHADAAAAAPAARDDGAVAARGAATIVIDDELDLEGSANVRAELVRLLEEGVVDLSVDLSRCPFVDSVGVSLLLTTLETLEHAGGRLRVVGATGRTRMVLQTAGVHDVLTRGR